jgi:hypothetical protein
MKHWILLFASLFALPNVAYSTLALETDVGGQVQLPLAEYQQLLELANRLPTPAPSSYAVGQTVLDLRFREIDGLTGARVSAVVEVETFADDWTLVPLLGPGAALESASLNGVPVQLVQRSDGLFWLSESRRSATLRLTYHVDARFNDGAYIVSVPVPESAATRFAVLIPRSHIDLSIAPAANLTTSDPGNGTTQATGTLPTTPSMMISWRAVEEDAVVLSRAVYSGRAQGEAIRWQVQFAAEMLTDGERLVPLLATEITLVEARVDGEPAMILNREGHFSVRLSGAGQHKIELTFLSPISYPNGVPSTEFGIPLVPVSRFELDLPGQKGLQVSPTANVELDKNETGGTHATFHTRLSETLALSWMEAIPEDVDVTLRANAEVYQALHAAEGVLYGEATVRYEITRGEANTLSFSLPNAAQVNRITSSSAAIADWITEAGESGRTNVRIFLNRAVAGEFILNVSYETLLEQQPNQIGVPLLRALDVARQRGMVALVAGTELALMPESQLDMAEVGENQLPAFFRNQLEEVVLHTFKYHSKAAALVVNAITPERKQGKFNAQIDTLVSIGEVTLKGVASIENDVKSGVLRDLDLSLPADVNVLGVSGPSIRSHSIRNDGQAQQIHIEFTQEMDGQFRIEVNFERIMLDGVTEATVPRIEVPEADVEHGRIAIEALSALEVQAARVDQLSSLEINELPKQLVLKTTNPILLAYKYVRTDEPFSLLLKITRHKEIDVQVAAIDSAKYQTLFTRDGLAVTRARFDVRNSRRQFLRLSLPGESEIWSVFVNGRAQKPAFASDDAGGARDVLIKMINSATTFPVELIYATQGPAISTFGNVSSHLPRPDMIVTHTNWDVYVPTGPRYSQPDSNMETLSSQLISAVKSVGAQVLYEGMADVISGEPLRIELPTEGLLVRFSKLYANQSLEDARFSMRYVNQDAHRWGLWLSLLATLAIWGGIIMLGQSRQIGPAYLPQILIVSGAISAVMAIGGLEASVYPTATLALIIGVIYGTWLAVAHFRSRALTL